VSISPLLSLCLSPSAPEEDIKQSSMYDQMSHHELTSVVVDGEQEFGRSLDVLIDNFLLLGEVPFGMLLGLCSTTGTTVDVCRLSNYLL
jgi:hypothetical protein